MSKPKSEFVQDFIPVKDIRHGIIETTDGRYIKILEIEPINFMLRSDEEQFGIISSFANWLKISPMRMQFKSVTRKADSEKHIAMLREELKREDNPRCKELSEGYIGLIRDVGSREALTRRFFLIFQYEDFQRTDDFSKIYGMLQTAEQNARAYFNQCGNAIVQPQNEDEATAEILYMYFNRRSCTDEPFADRVQRIILDRMKLEGKTLGIDPVPEIPITDFIAPRGIDLTKSSYIIMDGLYYTFLYIKGDGFPSRVRAAWMSMLINAGEGIDVDVHLKRESRSKTIDIAFVSVEHFACKCKDIPHLLHLGCIVRIESVNDLVFSIGCKRRFRINCNTDNGSTELPCLFGRCDSFRCASAEGAGHHDRGLVAGNRS